MRHPGPRRRASRCRRRGRLGRDRRAHSAGAGGRRGDRVGARCGAQHQPLRRSLLRAGRGQRRAFLRRALESFLDVPARIAEHVAPVWGSGFSERLVRYRAEPDSQARGSPGRDRPADGRGDASGVAFSADPVTGAPGSPSSPRRGPAATPSSPGPSRRHLARRPRRRHRRAPGGHRGHRARRRRRGLRVAALARAAERTSACRRTSSGRSPTGGSTCCRSRPITTLAGLADPDGRALHLGQQQHRRELRRRHHAADVLVRPARLRGGLPRVLPPPGRARRDGRGTRRRPFAACSG